VTIDNAQEKNAEAVRGMFDDIAHRYDFLNHFLSFGVDILWRKEAVACFESLAGKHIFDIACGTGDLSLTLAEANPTVSVVAADFSEGMVAIGKEKILKRGLATRISITTGDALAITHDDESFDGVTCAFGVRNFADLERGLTEMARVLKPGGRMVILEFTTPRNRLIGLFYRLYFTRILPILGGLISGKKSAYTYLPDTVYAFPKPPELVALLEKVGLEQVSYRPLTFGISCIHTGLKR